MNIDTPKEDVLEELKAIQEKRIKEPKSIIAIMAFSIIFMVTIGVYPEPIIQFTEFATPAINAGFMP